MDNVRKEAFKKELESDVLAQRAKAEQLRAELDGVEREIERSEIAIAVLDGKEIDALQGKAGKRRKQTKPSAQVADIIEAIAAVLLDNPQLNEAELFDLAEEKIQAEGFSRMGFRTRFKEAIADKRFAVKSDGVHLMKKAVA